MQRYYIVQELVQNCSVIASVCNEAGNTILGPHDPTLHYSMNSDIT